MNPKVNVALVGISGYGESYLQALLDAPRGDGFRIVGVVDPVPHRCRRIDEIVNGRRIPVHADLDALYEGSPKIDLVMMATPIHLHAPHTCLALSRGSSVLCEKPLGATVEDAARMLASEEQAEGFTAIGFQWSFSAAVQALKRDVMAGTLGAPLRLKTIVYFPRGTQYFRRNDWAGRIRTADGTPVFDSPVNNATAHYLHNMFYLLGPTRETSAAPVTVRAELYRANEIENYDTAALRAVTAGGTEILFYTTHAVAERQGPRSRYEFEEAVVEFDMGSGQFVARFRDGRVKSYGQPNLDRHEKIWQSMDAVRSGERVACGIRAAMAHTACVAAAQRSAPIVPFPARLRRTVQADGEPMVSVHGLYPAFNECYDRGLLPAEHGGLDWAMPGTTVEVTDSTSTHRRSAMPIALPA